MSSVATSNPRLVSTGIQALKRVSKARYLAQYLQKEDGFKYEWNNGVVEKSLAMNQQQAIIQALLLRYFEKTIIYAEGGTLIAETDIDTSPQQIRKPDLAIFSREQLRNMFNGQREIPTWVAEIISPSDNANKIFEKLEEYFQAGIQVVWHIYPESRQVYVYTSPDQVSICRGKTICDGAPAVEGLHVPAETLFLV
jgi:Uma2 family endonuclease